MAPIKYQVRAQRKYAHKTNNVACITPEPMETEQPVLAKPIVRKVRKPAKDLLNDISFQKRIHGECSRSPREIPMEKTPCVVLVRYEPPEAMGTCSPIAKPGPSKIITPGVYKTTLTKKGKNIVRSNELKLRTRIVTRHSILKKNKKRPFNQASTIVSDDTEDNRPLTFFAANKESKQTRTREKPSKNQNRLKDSKIRFKNKKATTKTNKNNVLSSTSKSPENEVAQTRSNKQARKINTSVQKKEVVQKSRFSSSSQSESVPVKVVQPCSLTGSSQSESVPVKVVQPCSLTEFVIKLINKKDLETEADGCVMGLEAEAYSTGCEDNPTVRVEEWLNKNSERSQDNLFKVPMPPRRLQNPNAPLVASTSGVTRVDLSLRERNLRNMCPTWNFSLFCEIENNNQIIADFCGQCTRCKTIFTRPRESMFANIADDELTAYEYFKSFLSKTGQLILEAVMIVKNIFINNGILTQRQECILGRAIGVLYNEITPNLKTTHRPRGEIESVASSVYHQPQTSKLSSFPKPPISITSAATDVEIKGLKFYADEAEFMQGPIYYAFQKCNNTGLCGVATLEPYSFKPSCTNKDPQLSFRVNNQYIHRMFQRWSPATRELTAIRSTQDPKIQRSPLFEGLEVDLVRLYHAVQEAGGIEACQSDHDRWNLVAQKMQVVCRRTKLENIYLKYLIEYNALTKEEKQKACNEVQNCWTAREAITESRSQHPLWRQEQMCAGTPFGEDEVSTHLETVCAEAEECITQGRTTNLAVFMKLAQQVMSNHFPQNCVPSTEEVEKKYWSIVMAADSHVCVHAASVDATEHGVGFSVDPEDQFTEHPWNLKTLSSNPSNLLSYLGSTPGVSSTTVRFGMTFATSPWHMDPTSVPWIEYLHEGAPKIWYSISADQERKFRAAATAFCPFAVQNKDIWLPCDIIMIPPVLLRSYGVVVQRHVQHKGEYVIVFPNTFCACVDTGFSISEGVYFAPHSWINKIENIFENLRTNCEPSLFSMEQLLIALANDERTSYSLLKRVHLVLATLLRDEKSYRQRMASRGIELMTPDAFLEQNPRATATSWQIQKAGECAYCRRHLYLSRVVGIVGNGVCAMHGVSLFESAVARHEQLPNVYCIMLVHNSEINDILNNLQKRFLESFAAKNRQTTLT